MRWKRGHVSANVEDRRGGRSAGVKLGGGGLVLGLILMAVFGQDVMGVMDAGGPVAGAARPGGEAAGPVDPAEQELVEFVSFVLDDIQASWAKQLPAQAGTQYRTAKLVLFTDSVSSACGNQSSAVGPFYCPADEKAYIDLGFYQQLSKRFGAPGDFAQAYVLAHEIGHHIQNITGTNARVHAEKQRDPANANTWAIRMELQADCLAGVWAHGTKQRDLLQRGDLKEGLEAASAIGDDTLQRKATGHVQPESWTHGSSDQRVRWFKKGYDSGDFAACDTFSAKRL